MTSLAARASAALSDMGADRVEGEVGQARPTRGSSNHALLHRHGDIALGMQYPPDPYVTVSFDIENEIGIASELVGAQTRQVQFMRIARRADAWIARYSPIGGLDRINEAKRDISARFRCIPVDRPLDILSRKRPQDDSLVTHSGRERATRWRKSSK